MPQVETGTCTGQPSAGSLPPAVPPRKQASWDTLDVNSISQARSGLPQPQAASGSSAAGASAPASQPTHAGSGQVRNTFDVHVRHARTYSSRLMFKTEPCKEVVEVARSRSLAPTSSEDAAQQLRAHSQESQGGCGGWRGSDRKRCIVSAHCSDRWCRSTHDRCQHPQSTKLRFKREQLPARPGSADVLPNTTASVRRISQKQ